MKEITEPDQVESQINEQYRVIRAMNCKYYHPFADEEESPNCIAYEYVFSTATFQLLCQQLPEFLELAPMNPQQKAVNFESVLQPRQECSVLGFNAYLGNQDNESTWNLITVVEFTKTGFYMQQPCELALTQRRSPGQQPKLKLNEKLVDGTSRLLAPVYFVLASTVLIGGSIYGHSVFDLEQNFLEDLRRQEEYKYTYQDLDELKHTQLAALPTDQITECIVTNYQCEEYLVAAQKVYNNFTVCLTFSDFKSVLLEGAIPGPQKRVHKNPIILEGGKLKERADAEFQKSRSARKTTERKVNVLESPEDTTDSANKHRKHIVPRQDAMRSHRLQHNAEQEADSEPATLISRAQWLISKAQKPEGKEGHWRSISTTASALGQLPQASDSGRTRSHRAPAYYSQGQANPAMTSQLTENDGQAFNLARPSAQSRGSVQNLAQASENNGIDLLEDYNAQSSRFMQTPPAAQEGNTSPERSEPTVSMKELRRMNKLMLQNHPPVSNPCVGIDLINCLFDQEKLTQFAYNNQLTGIDVAEFLRLVEKIRYQELKQPPIDFPQATRVYYVENKRTLAARIEKINHMLRYLQVFMHYCYFKYTEKLWTAAQALINSCKALELPHFNVFYTYNAQFRDDEDFYYLALAAELVADVEARNFMQRVFKSL